MQQAAPPFQTLWQKWQKNKDEQAGNELVSLYMPLVDYQVRRISSHLPKNVSKQEITSLALMGLVDALEKFDVNRDLKFDTYASFRIRGAIIDGLRKEDWLPRTVREKAKQIESISRKLEQRYNRTPTSKEIALEGNMTADEVEEIMKDSLFANVLSIEEKNKDDQEKKEGIGYSIPDNRTPSPEGNVLYKEKVKELTTAIQNLNEKEQLVVSLFYQEELTLTEIGDVMGLSTSRISQIHSKAIVKLRDIISKL
ncbi:FliA/WhiG family RNA polymerase sigma factor [Salirhabdus sp. Marseille-P4669]|uniref:FliA/WhiG family RNA polymerase sigma factor n=1 Tax=Salirhabdus sp. Marseille-P4669 TaxID=2042310 RepID=UPI000C79B605|nr:FliA/WhiG family RNA polymerase sigma factor [Salirhabdus sp. Marseille-P4669]